MTRADIATLRESSVSQGIMLESAAERLWRARRPAFRLARQGRRRCGSRRIEAAGEATVPFTTGILIGIGETRAERIEALLAMRDAARRARPHPGNHHPEFPRQAGHAHGAARRSRRSTSMLWTIAVARLMFGADDEHPGAAQPAGPGCWPS